MKAVNSETKQWLNKAKEDLDTAQYNGLFQLNRGYRYIGSNANC